MPTLRTKERLLLQQQGSLPQIKTLHSRSALLNPHYPTSAMVLFNTLIPALTITVNVNNVLPIGNGSLSTGSSLILGHINSGTLVSVPGFGIPINATIQQGDDWPTIDPDQKHARPNLRALATTDDGERLEVLSSGIQVPTPEFLQIIQGAGNGSLPWGSTYSGEQLLDP